MTPYELAAVHGKEAHIRKATVRHIETGEEHSLLVDQLLINHGYKSDLGAVLNWGLTIKEERIAVHSNMATSTPGIFAVGDVACYDNKLKLIAAGFTEGPTALNSAKLYLDPQANTMAAVSTHHAQLLRMTR
jgi:thioredoxin reductase (NADPH)